MELYREQEVNPVEDLRLDGRLPYRTWLYGDIYVAAYTDVEHPERISHLGLVIPQTREKLFCRFYKLDYEKNLRDEQQEISELNDLIHTKLVKED